MELSFQNVPPDEIGRHLRSNVALSKMVAEGMGVERFTEAAIQLLKQPSLVQCTQESVLGCLLKAAMFNFRLSPELGQCWIVPRKLNVGTKENAVWAWVATFQIGYKGWIELAFRSGEVESFDFAVVCENDTFDFQQGTTAFLNFRPHSDALKRGKRTHVWASAVMRSGRVVFNVVDIHEVERHRKLSDTQTAYDPQTRQKSVAQNPVGIWAAHYDQMAKRIPTKYLCSLQLPKSELILRAIEADGGVTDVTGDNVFELPIKDVEEMALPATLHPDFVTELESAASGEELGKIFNRQKKQLTGELLEAYGNEVRRVLKEKFPGYGKS